MSPIQFQIPSHYLSRVRSCLAIWLECQSRATNIDRDSSDICQIVRVDAAIFDRSGMKIPDREVNSDRVNWQTTLDGRGSQI